MSLTSFVLSAGCIGFAVNWNWNWMTQLYEQKLRTDASLIVKWYWAGATWWGGIEGMNQDVNGSSNLAHWNWARDKQMLKKKHHYLFALIASDSLVRRCIKVHSEEGDAIQGTEILTAARVWTEEKIQSIVNVHFRHVNLEATRWNRLAWTYLSVSNLSIISTLLFSALHHVHGTSLTRKWKKIAQTNRF